MKNVLVLGAGLVSRPLVSYLLARTNCHVLVSSRTLAKAEMLVEDHPRGRARQIDIEDEAALEPLIREASIVVSLAPAHLHPGIARLAIRNKAHIVTTSYVSEEMRSLDEEAQKAGVLVLNEAGLDPGIDHMSTMQVIHRVEGTGGSIVQFSSCCGGLPAPEANTNPWGYKFSWSPRAAILAASNPARYLRQGKVVEIEGRDLLAHRWPYEVEGVGLHEVYPNRDSLAYIENYRLGKVRNMFRGTLRNPGWCETFQALGELGLLDTTERDWPAGTTYSEFMAHFVPDGSGSLVKRLAKRLGLAEDHDIIARLEWAGLLSRRKIGTERLAPFEVLARRMSQMMPFRPGERDMIILRHEFIAEWSDRVSERIVSLLVAFGDPDGDSAMATTVSLPAAVSTRLLAEGKLEPRGVHIPVLPEIYVPVLAELEKAGITFKERTRRLLPGPFDPD